MDQVEPTDPDEETPDTMSMLRDIIVWAGIILVAAMSAAVWAGAMAALMLWPLQSTAILALLVVISMAVVYLLQVRLATAAARLAEPQMLLAPPVVVVAEPVEDPLLAVLGEELFRELSALGATRGTVD